MNDRHRQSLAWEICAKHEVRLLCTKVVSDVLAIARMPTSTVDSNITVVGLILIQSIVEGQVPLSAWEAVVTWWTFCSMRGELLDVADVAFIANCRLDHRHRLTVEAFDARHAPLGVLLWLEVAERAHALVLQIASTLAGLQGGTLHR